MKTFLFAGASSAIAKATAGLLQAKNHRVIGISTKPQDFEYDDFYQIEKYDFESFPQLNYKIDGLVYFPGTINLKPFHRLKAAEFLNDLMLNSLGAAAFVQQYLPNIKQSEKASIVFVSTVAVQLGLPFHSSIAMAKGAIEGLTKSLAAEFAPNIRVNCVAPSLVATPLAEKFVNTPEKLEAMQKRNPMQHVGDAIDIANGIAFLLSEDSKWISGQIMAIDGGMGTIKNN
jgi:3-oxoacyl-[acyl-carrier protein] reductase